MSKRGGARLFVAAGQPQGGGCIWKFKGGENNSRGGHMPPPPLNTPLVVREYAYMLRCCTMKRDKYQSLAIERKLGIIRGRQWVSR